MNIKALKQEFKAFLIASEYSPNMIKTSCTDAFYFYRHNCGVDFNILLQENVNIEDHKDAMLATLQKTSSGDAIRNINGYIYHLKKLREFMLSKDELTDRDLVQPTQDIIMEKHRSAKVKCNIPAPNVEIVKSYLLRWDTLENYRLQEDALNKLFFTACPKNTDISDVLVKVAVLNDFYSTNIFSVFPVAKHIVNLNIDERLNAGDISLVDDIQNVIIGGKEKHLYSFATKYCSHHNPAVFPIYDSYVDKVLWYFQKLNAFSQVGKIDLKAYSEFEKVLTDFRSFYGLEIFTIKEIDKFLWQYGKEYFPKSYKKALKRDTQAMLRNNVP